MISCPVASVLSGKEEGFSYLGEKEKRFKSWKKLKFSVDIHPSFDANDTSGYDMIYTNSIK